MTQYQITATLAGPRGPAGPAGPAGADGADGADGAPGATLWVAPYTFQAATGIPGVQGDAAADVLPATNTTMIYLTYEPAGTLGSYAPILRRLPADAVVTIQDEDDETVYAAFTITAAVQDFPLSRCVGIPVTYLSSSGSAVTGMPILVFVTNP